MELIASTSRKGTHYKLRDAEKVRNILTNSSLGDLEIGKRSGLQSDKQKAIHELAIWIKDKYPQIVSGKNIPFDNSYFKILSHANLNTI
jgi:hypothetical protein